MPCLLRLVLRPFSASLPSSEDSSSLELSRAVDALELAGRCLKLACDGAPRRLNATVGGVVVLDVAGSSVIA